MGAAVLKAALTVQNSWLPPADNLRKNGRSSVNMNARYFLKLSPESQEHWLSCDI